MFDAEEGEGDDELDYLIAIASSQGSLSPNSNSSESSSRSSGSSGSEEFGEEIEDREEFPFFGTGDIADEKLRRRGADGVRGIRREGFVEREERRGIVEKSVRGVGMGIGVRIVGEENEVERQLYEDMEEYDLILG